MEVRFEWDTTKAAANLRKHDVSFDEAATVFQDTLAVIFEDKVHSSGEPREIIIGQGVTNRLLLVCFTERRGSIRIISTRRPTNQEREDYEEYHSY